MGADLTEGVTDAGACDSKDTQLDRELFRPVRVHVRGKAHGDTVPPGQAPVLSA
jgi:hypothetical protein